MNSLRITVSIGEQRACHDLWPVPSYTSRSLDVAIENFGTQKWLESGGHESVRPRRRDEPCSGPRGRRWRRKSVKRWINDARYVIQRAWSYAVGTRLPRKNGTDFHFMLRCGRTVKIAAGLVNRSRGIRRGQRSRPHDSVTSGLIAAHERRRGSTLATGPWGVWRPSNAADRQRRANGARSHCRQVSADLVQWE